LFLAGLIKIENIIRWRKTTTLRPKLVYHYIQWKNIEPDFVVDVTGFMDVKTAAVLAYSSSVL
jgi:LmbE family N-acetylglucosaminyl deacetylase